MKQSYTAAAARALAEQLAKATRNGLITWQPKVRGNEIHFQWQSCVLAPAALYVEGLEAPLPRRTARVLYDIVARTETRRAIERARAELTRLELEWSEVRCRHSAS